MANTIQLSNRVHSIDALRGLAMFLILSIDIGGAPIFATFFNLWGEDFSQAASKQLHYNSIDGLRLAFMAMPMFLFVVGVVIPLSMKNRQMQKDKRKIYIQIIKRSVILFILGTIADGRLFDLPKNMPVYNNVLEFIAIGYLVCSILVLNTKTKSQVILAIVLLLSYWVIFLFIRVPGWDGDIYSGDMNLAIYIDNIVLGPFHKSHSWEVLATINFIANILIGVIIGQLIFSAKSKQAKTKWLVIYGLLMLLIGVVWGQFFPIRRNLWTSSYVLVTCGISTLLLACFYYLMDVCGYTKWAFFFVVFGVNSIAIYMMAHLFDFRLVGNIFVGGISALFPKNIQDFIQAIAAMAVMWLITYFLYRKKIFFKV